MKIAPLKISLFIVITVSITMIVAGLLFYKNLVGLLGAWNQSSKMSVFLKVDTTKEDRNEIILSLQKNPNVTAVSTIDRKQAGAAFQDSLKEFSSGLISEDEMIDLIPETLEVELSARVGLTDREAIFKALAKELKLQNQIEEVSYSANWLKKFELVDNILRSIGLLVFFILLCSISYLIALMVRVYIDDSKQEIEVYSLLGTTRWSIYKLFLKDVFIFLSASLLTSFGLLFFLYLYIKNRLSTSEFSAIAFENIRFLNFSEAMFVVFALFVFIYLNSFITIQNSVNKLNQLSND